MYSDLKIITLLLPDACGRIEAGRGEVGPAWGPGDPPHGALVPVLEHTQALPGLACIQHIRLIID